MPWAARRIIAPENTVYMDDPPFLGSHIVGTQPPSVWGDSSDATYSYAEQEYGTLVGNFGPEVSVPLDPVPDLVVTPNSRCAVWVRMTTTASHPIEARLTASPGADYRLTNYDGSTGGLTAPAGWTVLEMQPTHWTVRDTLESWRDGSTLYLTFQHVWSDAATDPPGAFTASTYIYEARVVVYVESLVAPPCRIFPRSDGLGVGGGRHFPPPKSQQRSGRRFGYY